MKISNPQADALPSTIGVQELGQAMRTLDLAGVPPERRHLAILDHLGAIMARTIQDPSARHALVDTRIARALSLYRV